jgi:hypothetical protein
MNNCCICCFFTLIFTGDFNFKGLTAQRLYKSFGVKGLMSASLISAAYNSLTYLGTYLPSYLFTPWSRVLLVVLTGP